MYKHSINKMKKLKMYQAGGPTADNDLFKQFMAMMGGGSAANSGLFNFNFGSKKNVENGGQQMNFANTKLNNTLNTIGNTTVDAFMDYQQNKVPGGTKEDNQITQADAGSKAFFKGASMIPGPIGQAATLLGVANTIGGGIMARNFDKKLGAKADVFDKTSAFSGLTNIQDDIQADKNIGSTVVGGLVAGKKKKSLISGQNQLRQKGHLASGLLNYNKKKQNDALSSNDMLGQQNTLSQSGFNYDDMQFGKKGMKMEAPKEPKEKITPYKPVTSQPTELRKSSLQDNKSIIRKMSQIYATQSDLRKQIKEIEYMVGTKKIPSHKEGGPINVIVDGQLHAHKHDLKTYATFKDIDITEKGVPVILQEGGEINQVQEVEGDEIILHLELTKKMEELMKIGSEEAMIEAGKILSKEIIKNTKDSKSKLLKND